MDAIKIQNLSKVFRIPHERTYGIKSAFINLMKGNMKYENFYALKNINLTVKKGEFVGITGRNGSGKSTLLRIMAGIIKTTSGTIEVNGKVSPFLELGTGFQYELTAKENVYIYGTILGLTRKEIDRKFNDLINFADLERFVDTKLKNFSSGMSARLAFSIAIQVDADILLIDEVLAVGDTEFQKKCFNVFRNFKKEKKTIILVSHDINLINKFSDKTINLENGTTKS